MKLLIIGLLLIPTISYADIWEELKKGRPYISIIGGHIDSQRRDFDFKDGVVRKNRCDASARAEIGVKWTVTSHFEIELMRSHNSNLDCGDVRDDYQEFFKNAYELGGTLYLDFWR